MWTHAAMMKTFRQLCASCAEFFFLLCNQSLHKDSYGILRENIVEFFIFQNSNYSYIFEILICII